MNMHNNSIPEAQAPPSPSSQLTPPTEGARTVSICRRIQFMIPNDLPLLSEQAVDPNFFKASHMVQELSCSKDNNPMSSISSSDVRKKAETLCQSVVSMRSSSLMLARERSCLFIRLVIIVGQETLTKHKNEEIEITATYVLARVACKMKSKLCGVVALALIAVADGFVVSTAITTTTTTTTSSIPSAPISDAEQQQRSTLTHTTSRSKPALSSRRWLSQQHCYTDDDEQEASSPARRNAVLSAAAATLLSCSLVLLPNAPGVAAAPETTAVAASPDQAVVTDKVFFDVRISRQDGTFYVRDDLPDTIENQVFTGRLTIGLFGKAAPNHVQRFLSYVNTGSKPLDDNPLPSYSRSVFPQLDEATGVLYGGTIPSLEVTELQGSAAIRYGGRLLPAKLWVNAQEATTTKLSHLGKGLLTHKNLDVTPSFGITTRTDTTELDRTHTVFGKLLPDADSQTFLERVASLPVYSVDRPVPTDRDETAMDDAAAALYALQRDFFRGAAKNLGDTRIDKLVAGKLLRRVEVTQVGMV